MTRKYDICVFGATGFTGFLVAKHLATLPGISWAISGRNEDKLNQVKVKLGEPSNMGIIVADSSNYDSLLNMTSQCKAVATTVGPYLKYGEPLIQACIEAETHYADLTGEFPFIRKIIDKYHDSARKKQVKIVISCGYDCIPVDMCTFVVTSMLPSVKTLRALCMKANGLFSGGTLATGRGMRDWAGKPENKDMKRDPYVLAPDLDKADKIDKFITEKKSFGWDSMHNTFTMPYFMVQIDNRVVRRSLALRGITASYDEAMSIGAMSRVSFFALTHPVSFLRGLSPEPGEGPSESILNDGGFSIKVVGQDPTGKKCMCKLEGMGDPGYAATAIMLSQSALCLALDKTNESYGILTPSEAMGEALIERLEATKSFKFSRKIISSK